MKALKLKSSPDGNPVWGFIFYCGDEDFWEVNEVVISNAPDVLCDEASIEDIIRRNGPIKDIENFELVTVELTIKR